MRSGERRCWGGYRPAPTSEPVRRRCWCLSARSWWFCKAPVCRSRGATTGHRISRTKKGSVDEHAGPVHRGGDELEVDRAMMTRELVGVVAAAVGDRLHQLFVFAQRP